MVLCFAVDASRAALPAAWGSCLIFTSCHGPLRADAGADAASAQPGPGSGCGSRPFCTAKRQAEARVEVPIFA